jgi:phosphoserine phosphatase
MARSVAFYLTCFDEPRPLARPPEPLPEPVFEPEPEEEISFEERKPELTDELRAELVEEGRAAARAEHEEALARERAGFVLRLENERRGWAREEGERLGEAFRLALDEFAARIGEDVARVLEPFVTGEVREQMLASLMERLRTLLADRDDPVVHLGGPSDLVDAICEKLSAEGVATRIEDVGGLDVRARFESTTIETRLEEWIGELRDGDDAQ